MSLIRALLRLFRVLFIYLPIAAMAAVVITPSLLARPSWATALWAMGVVVVVALVSRPIWERLGSSGDSHGTAAFASMWELRENQLLDNRGLIIGRKQWRYLRFDRDGHLLTFAPTRTGKGVGCVIPNLLDHPGSVVVTDIKGENFAVSGRRRAAFGAVHALAPFDVSIRGAHYNPLDFIRVGMPEDVDDAALMADLLVAPHGEETFWDSEAQSYIAALLLYVASELPPGKRNLHHVWWLLMQDRDGLDQLTAEMRACDHEAVRRAGEAFSQKEERERSAVVSTCQTHLKIWKSTLLARATSHSTFQLEDIKRTTMSLYIVVPPELLEVYRPFVRLMVGLSVSAMTRVRNRPEERVLFLLDEVAALGRMAPIETGIAFLAGYGVSIWLFFQDLGQLQATYPKWRSIIANCNVRQAFGVADIQTARELSSMLGNRTVKVRNKGMSQSGTISLLPDHFSNQTGTTARPLMAPDEVMTMPQNLQLIFVQACRPILARKVQYFREWLFRRRGWPHN